MVIKSNGGHPGVFAHIPPRNSCQFENGMFLRYPFGHPLGEPFNVPQQMTIIREAFRALKEIKEPGTIMDLPYRWRREKYQN